MSTISCSWVAVRGVKGRVCRGVGPGWQDGERLGPDGPMQDGSLPEPIHARERPRRDSDPSICFESSLVMEDYKRVQGNCKRVQELEARTALPTAALGTHLLSHATCFRM